MISDIFGHSESVSFFFISEQRRGHTWSVFTIAVQATDQDSTVHSGWDWFIMHVKLEHSMDNGFIFKKINKN